MTFDDHSGGFQPFIAMALLSSDVVGQSIAVDEHLKPSPEQYAIEPGDKVILASSGAQFDNQLCVGEILDPIHYVEQFPDWEERLQGMHSAAVLLMRWRSDKDPTGGIGWFARVKMMTLSQEQFTQMNTWIDDGKPEETPDWLREKYDAYGVTMATISPDKVPRDITCGKCGSTEVILQVEHVVSFSSRVGEIEHGEKPTVVPIGEEKASCSATAHLHCMSCRANRDITREELSIPARSKLGGVFDH